MQWQAYFTPNKDEEFGKSSKLNFGVGETMSVPLLLSYAWSDFNWKYYRLCLKAEALDLLYNDSGLLLLTTLSCGPNLLKLPELDINTFSDALLKRWPVQLNQSRLILITVSHDWSSLNEHTEIESAILTQCCGEWWPNSVVFSDKQFVSNSFFRFFFVISGQCIRIQFGNFAQFSFIVERSLHTCQHAVSSFAVSNSDSCKNSWKTRLSILT